MKRELLTLLAMTLLLMAAGCSGGVGSTLPAGQLPGAPAQAKTLDSVETYRYAVTVEASGAPYTFVSSQTGAVDVADNREQADATTTIGPLTLATDGLRIGMDYWEKGDLPLVDQFGPCMPEGPTGAAARAALQSALQGLTGVAETVNGIAAHRFDLSGAQMLALADKFAALPAGDSAPAATLWVADGYAVPVKLVMDAPSGAGTGTLHFEICISHLNEALQIGPPAAQTSTARGASDGASAGDLAAGVGGAVVGAFTGADPVAIKDAVDTAAEAAPGIKANIENVKEYKKVYGGWGLCQPPEDKSKHSRLYNWFWGLFGY